MGSEFEKLISNEFLKEVFSQKVKYFSYVIGTKPGENYLSTIYRVQVTFEENIEKGNSTETKSVLVKCYPEKESTRKFLDSGTMFQTEYFVYRQFIPSLNGLAIDTIADCDLRNEAIINSAHFYAGNIVGNKTLTTFDKDIWTETNFLVLEDLREKGFKMLDGKKGLDLDHCLLVIHQLANVHALSWVYKQKSGMKKLVDKHEYLHDDQFRKGDEDRWSPFFKSVNDKSLTVIEKAFGAESDIFLKLKQLLSLDVLEIIMDFLTTEGINEAKAESYLRIKLDESITEPNEPWLVATHGDCYINNMMFSYERDSGQSEKPKKVILIDHQTFREACLTTELAYFIYSCTKPLVRKEIVNNLLKTYFEKFMRIISSVGGKPPVGFTYEAFERRWRRARIFALLVFIQLVPFIYKSTVAESGSTDLKKDKDQAKTESAQESENNQEEDEWKQILIQTVLHEYNDGIF